MGERRTEAERILSMDCVAEANRARGAAQEPAQYAETVRLVERSIPDRLRWLAELLDTKGDEELMRYAVGGALLCIAAEMEMPAAPAIASAGVTEPFVCTLGHHVTDDRAHSDGDV